MSLPAAVTADAAAIPFHAASLPSPVGCPAMRLIWPLAEPDGEEVTDVDAFVAAELRPRPSDRPWLAVNTITSLDGATAVDGLSGPLQEPADKAVFMALRAAADVVLAGASTVRAEGYGPARATPERRAARRARGQSEVPSIAVISRSLDLDPEAPLFTAAKARTIVLTCDAADAERRRALDAVADVAVCGAERVEPGLALAALGDRGASFVLCEGGPHLNGHLVAADVVDEWCLSLGPVLTGGSSPRASIGAPTRLERYRLDRILEEDSLLVLRYVRRTS
jgi:riboflavin biosynthesis pyrimidine reductase